MSLNVSHHVLPMQENVCSFSHFLEICQRFATYLFKIFSEELYYFQTGKPFRVLLQDYDLDCMNLLVFYNNDKDNYK